ncbi:heavy-metal-associated domain-containing protein [Massilia norwichensis]|uniref:Heavy-metal-associated domain-containing protein n=1 Tax=Massilia norwichensis TaxID=1442366 RepID=A0ABT2A664_9BURK|nr:heavy-metal-associated domain-containing protein [Massilia norwichensis]MCS0589685.1 heavy-metal-associated domain-containing protein [Massilia norwichensis]
MQQRFQLSTPLAFADVERITNCLAILPGVHGLDMAPGSRQIEVAFDERQTSAQAIVDAASQAGYSDLRNAPAGGCCGGCCGG